MELLLGERRSEILVRQMAIGVLRLSLNIGVSPRHDLGSGSARKVKQGAWEGEENEVRKAPVFVHYALGPELAGFRTARRGWGTIQLVSPSWKEKSTPGQGPSREAPSSKKQPRKASSLM